MINNLISIIRRLRIRLYPRYFEFQTIYEGIHLIVPDKSSFLGMCEEIFHHEIYKFVADTDQPRILDCGANIGLSIIYFKKIYPNSRIIAFEPDPKIFSILKKNLLSFKEDVILIKKGLGANNGQTSFFSEGADGGRVATDSDRTKLTQIEMTKLSPYLEETVDLLKIDIEGKELEVLRECQNKLKNVKKLFVEYHGLAKEKQQLNDLLSILSEAGFRYYLANPIDIKSPFMNTTTNNDYDLQLNIFAWQNDPL